MKRRLVRPLVRAARAGFTLIELMAVILIIGILMVFLLPRVPEMIDRGEVTACQQNMSEIYKALMLYQSKFGHAPEGSGAQFFAEIIASDTWESVENTARRLTCPAVQDSFLDCSDLPPEEWYVDLEAVTGGYSTYAGRNTDEYPLRRFPGSDKEALVADDNDPLMNHRTTTVVLFGGGAVGTYELYELKKDGVLTEDEEVLVVGPDSPVEALRKLSLD